MLSWRSESRFSRGVRTLQIARTLLPFSVECTKSVQDSVITSLNTFLVQYKNKPSRSIEAHGVIKGDLFVEGEYTHHVQGHKEAK